MAIGSCMEGDLQCRYCEALLPSHRKDCSRPFGQVVTFDLENSKMIARDLVRSCGLTPERLRELFPMDHDAEAATRKGLSAKYQEWRKTTGIE